MSLKPTYAVAAYKDRILSEIEEIDFKIQESDFKIQESELTEKDFYVTLSQEDDSERHYYLLIYVLRNSLETAKPIAEKLEIILSKLGYKTKIIESSLVWDEGHICIPIS